MISFICESRNFLSSQLKEHLEKFEIVAKEKPDGSEDFLIYCDEDENMSLLFRDGKTRIQLKNYFQEEFLKQKKSLNQKSLLRKALGKKDLPIYDLNAGFLKDSIQMLCMGYSVTAIEINRIPSFLISWVIYKEQEFVDKSIGKNDFRFLNQDSLVFIKSKEWNEKSILYLDPFFPDLKKARLKRKEMIFLKSFASEKFDERRFLDYCLDSVAERIVVKRQVKSPALGMRKPSYSLKGTTVRFDIYI